jgi:hypothetical protein
MPRTVALIGFLMSLVPLACATAFRPGLANAPQLNGSQTLDTRVHDAIANGGDSCERRLGAGPLRNEVPACVVSVPSVSNANPVAPSVTPAAPVPVPWVKPYSDRGSCPSWDNRMGRITIDEGFAFARTMAESCTTPL